MSSPTNRKSASLAKSQRMPNTQGIRGVADVHMRGIRGAAPRPRVWQPVCTCGAYAGQPMCTAAHAGHTVQPMCTCGAAGVHMQGSRCAQAGQPKCTRGAYAGQPMCTHV
eukprot:8730933-Pyramimonas_sp.AAC.1